MGNRRGGWCSCLPDLLSATMRHFGMCCPALACRVPCRCRLAETCTRSKPCVQRLITAQSRGQHENVCGRGPDRNLNSSWPTYDKPTKLGGGKDGNAYPGVRGPRTTWGLPKFVLSAARSAVPRRRSRVRACGILPSESRTARCSMSAQRNTGHDGETSAAFVFQS